MKKLLFSIFATLFVSLISFAQENDEILKDPNFIELENTRDLLLNKINDKIISKEYTLDEIKLIFKNGDIEQISKVYDFTVSDYKNYESRLSLLKTNLIKNFPELEVEIEKVRNCADCKKDINVVFDNINFLATQGRAQTSCRWLLFASCVALATEFPPAYPVAAYLCYCSWCSGSTPDRICI